jgi:hypothetical protein
MSISDELPKSKYGGIGNELYIVKGSVASYAVSKLNSSDFKGGFSSSYT